MDYISSDTNVWLDFAAIDQIKLPFLLPYTYLMNSDRALRKAAMQEGVQVMGTIGVLEQLHQNGYVSSELYKECLEKLQEYNGGKVRLPEKELQRRIDELR